MTQVKLWQIASKTPNALIMSDSDGNLITLPGGNAAQILVLNRNGIPTWIDNEALAIAVNAKNQSESVLVDAKAFTREQIAKLVDGAPMALDTLRELADKLGGQENALGALLLQLDGKANTSDVYSKTEADNLLGATLATGNAAIDQKFSAAAWQTYQDIEAAKSGAINTASDDATHKANDATNAAITYAQDVASQAEQNAISAAAADAQAKADSAEAKAIQTMSDRVLSVYGVKTNITACLFGAAANFSQADVADNGLPLKALQEITGVNVDDDPTVTIKAVFINGVAIGNDWQQGTLANGTPSSAGSPLSFATVRFSRDLAKQVFDGDRNTIMVLATMDTWSPVVGRPPLA